MPTNKQKPLAKPTAQIYLVHSTEQSDEPQSYCDVVWAETADRAVAMINHLRQNDDIYAYATDVAAEIEHLQKIAAWTPARIRKGLREIVGSYGWFDVRR